jgi:urocanate hydratase
MDMRIQSDGASAIQHPARAFGAAVGTELRCRGWAQEGILRMLENTVANGERPEDLVIYGGIGQAARNWECHDAIVESLRDLADDETLLIQSGKPVARFRTTTAAPRVLTANAQLVGNYATWDTFHELRERGLIMFGQYTAGAWQYIGQQGVLQSTYETLAELARQHFDGTLKGRITLTAGLGAMGGAQPLAITLLDGVSVVVEVDEAKADVRIEAGYLDVKTDDVGHAIELAHAARDARTPLSIGLVGNAAELLAELLDRGLRPDVVTDQTSAHDPRYGYIPVGMSLKDADALRETDPGELEARARASIRRHVEAMLALQDDGAVVFEYGNAIREVALAEGLDRAFDFKGFIPLFIRPNFCVGRGPCRWVALSGDPADIRRIDEAILEEFADDDSITRWIRLAMERVPHRGLPARTSWLASGQRSQFARMVNRMIQSGEISAPIAMSRDHLDSGSVCQPTRETEAMMDGSDPIADWPILNALLNTANGADLVALHQGGGSGMGGSISSGLTVIIEGRPESEDRLTRILDGDPGIGVIRHADAGYQSSIDTLDQVGLVAPMIGRKGKGTP